MLRVPGGNTFNRTQNTPPVRDKSCFVTVRVLYVPSMLGKSDCAVTKYQLFDTNDGAMHLGVLEHELVYLAIILSVFNATIPLVGDKAVICRTVLQSCFGNCTLRYGMVWKLLGSVCRCGL